MLITKNYNVGCCLTDVQFDLIAYLDGEQTVSTASRQVI